MIVHFELTLAWLMVGSFNEAFATAYGWTFLFKVAFFVGLVSLAALNKLKLVPGLTECTKDAGSKLRRATKTEGFFVLLILITTATLISVSTPPLNL